MAFDYRSFSTGLYSGCLVLSPQAVGCTAEERVQLTFFCESLGLMLDLDEIGMVVVSGWKDDSPAAKCSSLMVSVFLCLCIPYAPEHLHVFQMAMPSTRLNLSNGMLSVRVQQIVSGQVACLQSIPLWGRGGSSCSSF